MLDDSLDSTTYFIPFKYADMYAINAIQEDIGVWPFRNPLLLSSIMFLSNNLSGLIIDVIPATSAESKHTLRLFIINACLLFSFFSISSDTIESFPPPTAIR